MSNTLLTILAGVSLFIGLISAIWTIFLLTVEPQTGKCNVSKIVSRWLVDILFGKKYLVKVNGIWSVARGKRHKGNKLYILYGAGLHEWILREGCWAPIEQEWNDEDIQEMIIQKNIADLRSNHPTPEERSNILRRARQRELEFDDFDEYIRRLLESQHC